MKLKFLFPTLVVTLFLAVSCEKEMTKLNPEIDDEILVLVQDEILADISFAELLDEGDDGMFWGDAGFSLKSAEVEENDCRTKTVENEDNKRIVTLVFSDVEEGCEKSGMITIVYHKNGEDNSNREKTITYSNFVNKHGTEFNGVKNIKRGNGNYNIKAEMIITKENEIGDPVTITRNYERQVHWICGLDTRQNNEDNIKSITGKSEITKTVGDGEAKIYSRKILQALLIVKACELKVQAGTVKIEKANGTIVEIDYGKIPEEIECGTVWECNPSIEVTKDGETFTVEIGEDGKRIKPAND